jgi:glycosyltransferase involved in cell wall biosynthesis
MYGSGFTGIGRYTYELIRNLSELDEKNEYVIFLRKETFDSFMPPNQRFSKVLADFSHYSVAEQTGFLKILNDSKLDLMHFTHFNAPVFYNKPYIVTIHDLTLSFYPGKKMNNVLRRTAYRLVMGTVTKKAKKIIAVSEHTKSDLQKLYNIKDDRVKVIYNGINPEFSKPSAVSRPDLMKKLGIQKPYFLYTGVWRDHKNVLGLIRAFAKLNGESGKQYNLVITGRNNPSYKEVPDIIKDMNLESDVHLVGMVSEDDLTSLYQYALAYVFPSFYEGFGLPILEAMQCGTPVVASDRSAIPEISGEGNALFFNPDSIDEMAEKMKIAATDPSVRRKLIDRGLERVKDFDWRRTAADTLEIYNSINQMNK